MHFHIIFIPRAAAPFRIVVVTLRHRCAANWETSRFWLLSQRASGTKDDQGNGVRDTIAKDYSEVMTVARGGRGWSLNPKRASWRDAKRQGRTSVLMDAIKRRSGTNGTSGTYIDGPRPGVLEHFERFSEVLGSRRRRLTAARVETPTPTSTSTSGVALECIFSRAGCRAGSIRARLPSREQHKGRARSLAAWDRADGGRGRGRGGEGEQDAVPLCWRSPFAIARVRRLPRWRKLQRYRTTTTTAITGWLCAATKNCTEH